MATKAERLGSSFPWGEIASLRMRARPVAVSGGREAFDRLIGSLEDAKAAGDVVREPAMLERSFAILERAARKGSVVVVLSDLIDLPRDTAEHFSAMAARGRSVVV